MHNGMDNIKNGSLVTKLYAT